MSRVVNALLVTAAATGIAALVLAAATGRPRRLTASPAEPPMPGRIDADALDNAEQRQLIEELGAQLTG